MAAKKKTAIQLGNRPEGIVDDILVPIAKGVIRATRRSNSKALAKEVKIISGRHEKLLAARKAANVYGKTKSAARASKKITKNMRAGSETARKYGTSTSAAGLPTGAHKISRSSAKYADFLTERALKKSPTGRIGGDELMSIGRRSSATKKVTRSSVKRDYPYTNKAGKPMDKKVVRAMRKDKLAAAKRNKKGK